MSREDLELARRRKKSKTDRSPDGGGSADGGGPDDEDTDEEMPDIFKDVELEEPDGADGGGADMDVGGELALMREEMLVGEEVEGLHFQTGLRGGASTYAVHGVVADGVRGEAKTNIAKQWARGWGFPQSKTFSIALYGRENSMMLSREFCRRGIFL